MVVLKRRFNPNSHQYGHEGLDITRERDFRKYWPRGFKSDLEKEEDDWCRKRLMIYGFNEACSNIAVSYIKAGDDSMSAIRFHIRSKGDLPKLSYIFHKPEPLGIDLKTVA